VNTDGIGALFETSPHRADVEAFLRPRRLGRRRLKRYLQKEWRRYNTDRISAIRADPLEPLDELPYSEVVEGSVTYRIHGMVHDQRGFGLRMRPEVRAALLDLIRGLDGPGEGYVLEHGFGKNFDLPTDRDAGRGRNVLDEVGGRVGLSVVLRRLPLLPLIPILPLIAALSWDVMSREIGATLKDIRHLTKLREVYRLAQLPEPLATELEPYAGGRFVWAMSEGMAKAMRERANANDWKIVHCVCGLTHEAQIVLALKGERPKF
jgi:hypothetical protein